MRLSRWVVVARFFLLNIACVQCGLGLPRAAVTSNMWPAEKPPFMKLLAPGPRVEFLLCDVVDIMVCSELGCLLHVHVHVLVLFSHIFGRVTTSCYELTELDQLWCKSNHLYCSELISSLKYRTKVDNITCQPMWFTPRHSAHHT